MVIWTCRHCGHENRHQVRYVGQKMLARYSHVRSEARRQAVTALSAKPRGIKVKEGKVEGYDTSGDATDMPAPQVIEKMVGTRRLELLTSTVSNLEPVRDTATEKKPK